MRIVQGIEDDIATEIMYDIARKPAYQYLFGYHDVDDMVHQIIIEIMEQLDKGKFKPRGPKALEQQFKNWLRVWMRNKASNFRRKHSCRYANADTEINQSKFKIMHPLKIHSQGLTQSEIFARSFSAECHLHQEDALRRLSRELSPEDLSLLHSMINGDTLPLDEDERLFLLCKEIICEET